MRLRLAWLSAFCLTTLASGTALAETTGPDTSASGGSTPSSLAITSPEDGAFVDAQFDVEVVITEGVNSPVDTVTLFVDGEATGQNCTPIGSMCLFSLELDPGEYQIEANAQLGAIADVINVTVLAGSAEGTDGGEQGEGNDTDDDVSGTDGDPAAEELDGGKKGCSISGRPAALPALALLLLFGIRRRR